MRTTGTILATAAGALLLSASPAPAQPSGTLTEGARVRIFAPEIHKAAHRGHTRRNRA